MHVVVVTPTYQEAANIETVLRRTRRALPEAAIIVVDDASPDGTAEIAAGLVDELGEIQVVRRASKAGLGSAYRDGFARALAQRATAVVEMDADLSHDPAALPSLVAPVDAGTADLVIGSRYVPGGTIPSWAWHRRMLSRWGNRYAAALLGLRCHDATSGYRAYSAAALEQIDLDAVRADGYGFQIEMAYLVTRAGGRVHEVPIDFVERVEGTSKMSIRIVVEALLLVTWWGVRDLLTRRRGVPDRR